MNAVTRTVCVHVFRQPLPYLPTLNLQNKIHEIQLHTRRAQPGSHKDVLLLLEHRPVYTTGRRQTTEEDINQEESTRLQSFGADNVSTKRGGQTTYHGPGQVVGYPLLDLSRMGLSISEYICKLQTAMKTHFSEHYGIKAADSDNTGLFLSKNIKLGSIGVQVRHRLTSHGIAYNVTREPLSWFNQIVACGLVDVKAGCLSDAAGGRDIFVQSDMELFLRTFAEVFHVEFRRVDADEDKELWESIKSLEMEAARYPVAPVAPVLT